MKTFTLNMLVMDKKHGAETVLRTLEVGVWTYPATEFEDVVRIAEVSCKRWIIEEKIVSRREQDITGKGRCCHAWIGATGAVPRCSLCGATPKRD
jgi:hypothetical protein